MSHALRLIDWLTRIAGYVAAAGILLMIGVILYEIASRYFFNAPTVWAYDISYMLNGSVIMLAGALAMKADQHVVIDILSQLFRNRTRRMIDAAVYIALLLPALGFISLVAWSQFWTAVLQGTVETVSPWRPVLWPFRLMIALGLSILWLQILAKTLASALRPLGAPSEPAGGR
ncbi:TRAP transporter small permease subunit [Pararhodobacter marinus]|uniref:TRAP transporter small permease subunit n=1 Tax=Pararhodobacter marinus TaxID=2184063 RepID=UPI003519ACF4